eukprot:6714366-Ditylum_brightwellii.AAC.1
MRHFCKSCQSHSISDPCVPEKSQDERIKSNTIMLYLKVAALLCEPRRLVGPLVSCCGRKSAWLEAVISEQRRCESMPNR